MVYWLLPILSFLLFVSSRGSIEEADCFVNFSQTPIIHKCQGLLLTRAQEITEKIMESSLLSHNLTQSQCFAVFSPPTLYSLSPPPSPKIGTKTNGQKREKAFIELYLVAFSTFQMAIL